MSSLPRVVVKGVHRDRKVIEFPAEGGFLPGRPRRACRDNGAHEERGIPCQPGRLDFASCSERGPRWAAKIAF